DELAVLVAVLGDGLGEDELARPAPLLLPRLAAPGRGGEDIADAQRAVVLVVLLGVQAAPATTRAAATAPVGPTALGALAPGTHQTGGLLAGSVPRPVRVGSEPVVRIELGARLDEGRWGDDAA